MSGVPVFFVDIQLDILDKEWAGMAWCVQWPGYWPHDRCPAGSKTCVYSRASTWAPAPIQLLIQKGVRRPKCKADNSFSPSPEIKNGYSYNSTRVFFGEIRGLEL